MLVFLKVTNVSDVSLGGLAEIQKALQLAGFVCSVGHFVGTEQSLGIKVLKNEFKDGDVVHESSD